MLSLIGALLGFFSSAVPSIMKIFTDKADHQHELDVMDRQIEMQKQGAAQKLEEINVQADVAESVALYKTVVPSGVPWVDALSGTVRPIITYSFFLVFAAVKGTALHALISIQNVAPDIALVQIWDGETAALFATVISFWFGARTLEKMRKGI